MKNATKMKKTRLRVVQQQQPAPEPQAPEPVPAAPVELVFRVVPQPQAKHWDDVVTQMVTDVKVRRTNGRVRHQVSWTPEAVLKVLAEGRGHLCLTMHGGKTVGAAVVCRDGDQFADAHDYLVWMAWAEPSNKEIARQVREFTQDGIEDFARSKGARCLRWYSARKGWLRTAPSLGYKLTSYCFAKRLN
jgi:hypothetical protein